MVTPASGPARHRSEWDWQSPGLLGLTVRNLLSQRKEQTGLRALQRGVRFTPADIRCALGKLIQDEWRKGRELATGDKSHWVSGTVHLIDPHRVAINTGGESHLLEGQRIQVALGTVPFRPSRFQYDSQRVLTLFELLRLPEFPSRIAVVGCGEVGFESALVLALAGVSVRIIERNAQPFGEKSSSLVHRLIGEAERLGVRFMLGQEVISIRNRGLHAHLELSSGRCLEAEAALITTGRTAVRDELNLTDAGLIMNENGLISLPQTCGAVWQKERSRRGPETTRLRIFRA